MILWSQVINGVLLPFVLIFMILLLNRKGLMKEWVASRSYNAVAWISVVVMIGLTLALVAITIHDLIQPASAAARVRATIDRTKLVPLRKFH